MKKLKELINRILDVPKLIITIWVILWLVLLILVVFKFCFNIWYPIVVENEKFIAVCEFIDNHKFLQVLNLSILYIFNFNIVYLICIKSKKYKNWLVFIVAKIFSIIMYAIKLKYNLIGLILEILLFCFILTIYNVRNKTFKKNILNYIYSTLIYVIINIWQSSLMFVRGLQEILTTLPTLIVWVLQIDYYVFLTITWIGVVFIMGAAGIGWWWSNQLTKYQAYKAKELKKTNPDMDYVSFCDTKIKECEDKLNEIKVKNSNKAN